MKPSPCVAVSCAVSATHAMIVDGDQRQRTSQSTQRLRGWSVHWTVDWVRVPTDNSHHLTLKTKENTCVCTRCIVKDHFHIIDRYCQREKFDHFDHFDRRCESHLWANFGRESIIKIIKSCTWSELDHLLWLIHRSLNWSVRPKTSAQPPVSLSWLQTWVEKTLLKAGTNIITV